MTVGDGCPAGRCGLAGQPSGLKRRANALKARGVGDGQCEFCHSSASVEPSDHGLPSLHTADLGKKASALAAIVGTRTFRSRKRLKVSHDVSDARMHAWQAAALIVACTSG